MRVLIGTNGLCSISSPGGCGMAAAEKSDLPAGRSGVFVGGESYYSVQLLRG